MKKFSFRLEKVLSHKERLFEIAKSEHSEILRELRDAEKFLDELRCNYTVCLNDLADKTKGNFKISELGPFYRYLSSTKKEIAVQSKVVCEIMDKENEAKEKLLNAAREKEVLIKLREKAYEKYLYETSREEQAFLDELNSMKHARAMEEV